MAVGERRAGSDGAVPEDDADRMTLVEHLTELRSRLMKAVGAVAIGSVIGFFLYKGILEVLTEPYCDVLPPDRECQLLAVDPLSPFAVRMKLAGYVGLVLASPVVLWQLWRFITPGLYPHEKRYAVPFVISSIVLFLLGAGLAYWTFPNALEFLAEIGGSQIETFYDPNKYLSLITFMMLAFGIGFEFPILLVFLQMAGVLSPARLGRWRRGALVFIFVFVAIITPSGDPFTLFALAIPMCVFYEASILVGRLLTRGR